MRAIQKPLPSNTLADAEKRALILSYINSNNYSLFQGTTQTNREGGWYGFKHSNTGVVIYMSQKLAGTINIPLFYIILRGETAESTTLELYYL